MIERDRSDQGHSRKDPGEETSLSLPPPIQSATLYGYFSPINGRTYGEVSLVFWTGTESDEKRFSLCTQVATAENTIERWEPVKQFLLGHVTQAHISTYVACIDSPVLHGFLLDGGLVATQRGNFASLIDSQQLDGRATIDLGLLDSCHPIVIAGFQKLCIEVRDWPMGSSEIENYLRRRWKVITETWNGSTSLIPREPLPEFESGWLAKDIN
jgi:hypothetical protein